MLIVYGSQTGTAQDVAEQIWRESKHWGFDGAVLAMDEWPVERLIQERLVIFVIATTGNGDEPDNMRRTWKFLLRRNLPGSLLANMQYACLGLGDSSYAKFNFAAKKLHKRLQQLGAQPLVPLGLGDDQHDHGLAAVSLPWMVTLWTTLQQQLVLQRKVHVADALKWRIEMVEGTALCDVTENMQWPLNEAAIALTLQRNKRTTADDHFQDVRLLCYSFPSTTVWQPGDVLQVCPSNSDSQVARFFALAAEHRWNFDADTVVRLNSAHADMPLPPVYARAATVRQLAKNAWDLSARPRQRVFELLALHCPNELEREKLEEFSTAEGLDELLAYVQRPRRTILEVLEDFRYATAALTLPLLVELFALIQPRSYSIASIPASGTLDLLVAVVDYRTRMSTPRLGLCSSWLQAQRVGTVMLAIVKRGTLRLPHDSRTPLILVGPGTGIAPFRSVVQCRLDHSDSGATVVFFGCRNRTKDCHFADDFAEWQSRNEGLVVVHVAFSRDQPEKVYVQHIIVEQRARLLALIEDGAFVMVAGASNAMPKAVRESFLEVLKGDTERLEQMIKCNRYQEETWS